MPTIVEVEDRLRRAAAACEPLVDELIVDEGLPCPLSRVDRRRRVVPWLVAAAVALVALSVVALVVVADGAGPEVRTSVPPSLVSAPTTVRSGDDVVPLAFPDGTQIELVLPLRARGWSPGDAVIAAELRDGTDVTWNLTMTTSEAWATARGAELTDLGSPGSARVLRSHVGDGLHPTLLVERDGWLALTPLVQNGDPLLDGAALEAFAHTIEMRVVEGGVVELAAEGMTIGRSERFLTVDGFDDFVVSVGDEAGWCEDDEASRRRCFADGRIAVDGRGETGDLVDALDLVVTAEPR